MSFSYFEAASHVSTYNKFRPNPPKKLIEKVIEFTREKVSEPLELAVDVGCGSGQSTHVLAPYFKKVHGFDSSAKIIHEARKKCHELNIFYSICPSEKMDLGDGTTDLVTVCQALHWFDIPKFYAEANRILKKKGVLAVYGYSLPVPVFEGHKEIEALVEKYYTDVLSEYSLPQSKLVYLNKYRSKDFNEVDFIEGGHMLRTDDFILEIDGSISDIMGYMASWSAFQNYTKQMGEESGTKLLQKFKNEFQILVRNESKNIFKIRYNFFLLLGRKQ